MITAIEGESVGGRAQWRASPHSNADSAGSFGNGKRGFQVPPRRPRPSGILTAVVLAPFIAGSCGPDQLTFDLHEYAAYPLASEIPAGLALSALGRIAVFEQSSPIVTLLGPDTNSSKTSIHVARGVVGVAFIGDTIVEVATDTPPALSRFTLQGKPIGSTPLHLDDRMVEAQAENGIWYFGTLALKPVRYRVIRRGANGPRNVFSVSGDSLLRSVPGLFRFSVFGGEVLVTRRERPFTVTRLDTSGAVLRSVEPGGIAFSDSGATERWLSLPALSLGAPYLQTLANVRTNERRILRVSRDGLLLKETILSAPIGFVASYPTERILVGVRSLRVREIVLYRWSTAARRSE